MSLRARSPGLNDAGRRTGPLWSTCHLVRSALTAVVPVRITLNVADRVVPDRLPVDREEHGGSRPRRPTHPDCGRHGSRDRVAALPHAAGRPQISPARRRLSLALLEAIFRECVHDILQRGAPPVLRFDPGHPALLAKLIEAVHEWHLLLPVDGRGAQGRTGRGPGAEAPRPAPLPAPIETAKLTVSSRYDDGIYANSRRISFSLFAFRPSAGKSTSRDWIASCP